MVTHVARKIYDPNKASNVEEKVDTLADSKQASRASGAGDSCRIFMEEIQLNHRHTWKLFSQCHRIISKQWILKSYGRARRRFEEFSAEHNVRTGRLQVLGEEINDLWDDLGVQEEREQNF